MQDINKFINSYEMTRKLMKKMQSNKGGMRNMMKNLKTYALMAAVAGFAAVPVTASHAEGYAAGSSKISASQFKRLDLDKSARLHRPAVI